MDKLDDAIARLRTSVSTLKAAVDTRQASFDEASRRLDEAKSVLRDAENELRIFERAAALRPSAHAPPQDAEPDARRGGRQKGSLSRKWKRALADFVLAGNSPVEFDTFYLVTRARLGLSQASVRERVRTYVGHGIMKEVGGKISVADEAIEKLRLLTLPPEDSPEDADEDSDESYPREHEDADNEKAPH
jgi:hypothetical protein